jgi:hypothetical protein
LYKYCILHLLYQYSIPYLLYISTAFYSIWFCILFVVCSPDDWKEFLGYLTALSEPQLHIVAPTVANVRRYVSSGSAVKFALAASGSPDDVTWLLVLLARLWTHENAWVLAQGILAFCSVPSLPVGWASKPGVAAFLKQRLVGAISDSRVFHVADSGGVAGLEKAFEKLFFTWTDGGKNTEEFERIASLVLSQNLGPIQLFLLSKALASFSPKVLHFYFLHWLVIVPWMY